MRFLLLAALGSLGFGQAAAPASPHLDRLLAHWRWMQYWKGAAEVDSAVAGSHYTPGTRATLLVFWPKDPNYTALGFCSNELRMCQMYLNPAGDGGRFELKMFPAEEPRQGFSRLVEEVLAPQAVKPKPTEADFDSETVTLALPVLVPPPGVAERKMAPRERIEALAQLFGCGLDKPDCKNHVLIPFFGDADLWVPVYSACARNCGASDMPSVTYLEWKNGAWWRGAPYPETTPAEVMRLRAKIEQALMLELPR